MSCRLVHFWFLVPLQNEMYSCGVGGGTSTCSCCTIRNDRSLRGLSAEALNARAMSSVEKESLRGRLDVFCGTGIESVMIVDVC